MRELIVAAALLSLPSLVSGQADHSATQWPEREVGLTTLKLDYSMEASAQARVFFSDPAYPGQSGSGWSIALEPEIDFEVPRGQLRLTAFARWDQRDDERSHVDLREFLYELRFGDFDLQLGVGRVFWGVTESVHLVDIINQTDAVENVDGEDKLGQAMINLAWTTRLGVFTGYVLPYFRERSLPGFRGRLRAPLPYARGDAQYESGAEQQHVDVAFRWSLTEGPMDLGLSHFSGTAREPRFVLGPALPAGELIPVYDQIDQSAIDLNLVLGGWLLKLEGLHQSSRREDYEALASGFEYTWSAALGSAWDIGALAEFLWDARGQGASNPFQKDLFVGSRLAANDIAGSEMLAGIIVDLEQQGWIASLEASRRMGANARLSLELRLFEDLAENDPLASFERDDHLQIEYLHYF